jgi:hypothetical protein
MKVIYVAGPFRADTPWEQEQNVRVAEEYALKLWKMGAAVICPHAMTRFYQDSLPDDTFLAGDFEILRRCDAIFLLPYWQNSTGTLQELQVADQANVRKLYSLPEAQEFLDA